MNKYKPITINRRARYDYQLDDKFIAGIVLIGIEAKSIRHGKSDLKGSFANLKGNELWLNNVLIPPYQSAKVPNDYDPLRPRKLLLHKRELKKLEAVRQNGKHLVPISIGKQGRFLKAEIGIGQSKKQYDKRETIKKRAAKRESNRHLKKHTRQN